MKYEEREREHTGNKQGNQGDRQEIQTEIRRQLNDIEEHTKNYKEIQGNTGKQKETTGT